MRPTIATTAAVLLCCTAQAAPAQSAAPASATPVRAELSLSSGWRFHQGTGAAGVESADFSDIGWETVRVPHTWNRVGIYEAGPDGKTPGPVAVNKAQGLGWYRLAFTPPPSFAGKRAWLQFDAASRTAVVWLNGVRLGEHRGGFSRFRLDATAAIRVGRPNLLVVKTDNSIPAPGSSTADVLPLTGDFFVYGGLYRPVSLIATDPSHIDMGHLGSSGVYASTTLIADGRAKIAVRTRVRNDGAVVARTTTRVRLFDVAGALAAEATTPLRLERGKGGEVDCALDVPAAHLWQGVDDPYLYRLVVEIVAPGGAVLDRVEQPFGIRQMRFDPRQGFFLNGKPLRLHGVGYHQDRAGRGWAMEDADIAADLAIMREMGVNTIRLTHYQHGQAVHDLADRNGLIVWDEIPLVSVWTQGDAGQASPTLLANARQQLQELIRQNYNHAAVASWGIANEVDFGNAFPGFLASGRRVEAPDPLPLLDELNRLAKTEDPSRPTALATCCEGGSFPLAAHIPITAPAADLGGANRYLGWYYGKPDDVGPVLDALHARRPDQPLAVTEYGAGGAAGIHTDDVRGGPVDAGGRNQPEEYQSYVHERNWAAMRERPYLWATWLWNSFDFASTAREEGGARDLNTKGLVTADRAIRKDAYFFYKANWSTAPTVYITGRRYVDRAYRVTPVRVYSNAPATELIVNGRSAGVRENCPERICVWPAVALVPGENIVIAKGRFASGEVADRIAWRLAPDAVTTVRIDSGALVAAPASHGRFGSDVFFEGGAAGSVNGPAGFGKRPSLKAIEGTPDTALIASFREGSFVYRVPLANGRYTVNLTFVEPIEAAGARRFDVIANGRRAISDLDVAASAGGPLKALTRHFVVMVTQGAMDLRFVPSRGEAIVSAIEISR